MKNKMYCDEIASMIGVRSGFVLDWIKKHNVDAFSVMQEMGRKKLDKNHVNAAMIGYDNNLYALLLVKKFRLPRDNKIAKQ